MAAQFASVSAADSSTSGFGPACNRRKNLHIRPSPKMTDVFDCSTPIGRPPVDVGTSALSSR